MEWEGMVKNGKETGFVMEQKRINKVGLNDPIHALQNVL